MCIYSLSSTGSCRTAGRPLDRPARNTLRYPLVSRLRGESTESAASGGSRSGGTRRGLHNLRRVDVLGLVDLDRRLLGGVARLHVQVVRRLHAALPRREVDVHHVAEVTRLEVHVAADGLVDPLLRASGDLEEGIR